MRNPCYSVSFGGDGPAWKIVYLPKGYGPDINETVVWQRELLPSDLDCEERYPPDVQEKLDDLHYRLRIARGFDTELARA